MPASLLPLELSGATIAVEVAWGANPNDASDSGWTWTDVTDDVRHDPAAKVTLGRSDEASTTQPAKLSLELDNSTGAYSLGPGSPNFPNVRRNVPVRVVLSVGSTEGAVFTGYATGFTPRWNTLGNVATVALAAAGTLRRMKQREKPVKSSLYTDLSDKDDVVAYWPLEEGKNATQFKSGRSGDSTTLYTNGSVSPGDYDDLPASSPLPTVEQGDIHGLTPDFDGAADQRFTVFVHVPSDGIGEGKSLLLCRVWTTGEIVRWDIGINDGGALEMAGYNTEQEEVFASGFTGFDINGRRIMVSLWLSQDGADTDWQIAVFYHETILAESLTGGGFSGSTLSGTETTTYGRMVAVHLGDNTDSLEGIAYGHASVINDDVHSIWTTIGRSFIAWSGEIATDRLERLTDENRIPLTIVGDSDRTMGPQPIDTVEALLRECETVDQGLLLDGFGVGLAYTARETRENQDPALTLDAAAGELTPALEPTDDDQRNVNAVTAKQPEGSEATVTDTTGPLGVDAIGLYDASIDVNTNLPERLADYASWLVHLGTVEGYRYPQVTVNVRAVPHLAEQVLNTVPSSVIEIVNARDVFDQLPDDTIRLVVEGVEHSINRYEWTVTFKCSPGDPWSIAELAEDLDDRGEFLAVLDTEDCELATAADENDTSLSVTTNSGPIWTTEADSFPFEITIDRVPVTVTNVTGVSTGQTMTVEPIDRDFPAGARIRVRDAPVLGL